MCNALYWIVTLWSAPSCDKVALLLEVIVAVNSAVMTGLRAGGMISSPELLPLLAILIVAGVAFVFQIYRVLNAFKANHEPQPHNMWRQ